MKMRRLSREMAMQILFQIEFAPQTSISSLLDLLSQGAEADSLTYTEQIIHGVKNFKSDIDTKIQTFSRNWKLERIATVDRNILRVAIFEMFFSSTPLSGKIAINEAVEIAKKYSTSESASFINGLLDQMYQEHIKS